MWVVLKYKNYEFQNLKHSFSEILGKNIEFYSPKIKYQKYIHNKLRIYNKNILDNYLFCKHKNFDDNQTISRLKNSRGLVYFLRNCESNQKELENFINFCKSNEDKSGFLTQGFFSIIKKGKAKFISGPFTQMIFDIIEDKGKKLKILINNVNMTISKSSSNLLYSYI